MMKRSRLVLVVAALAACVLVPAALASASPGAPLPAVTVAPPVSPTSDPFYTPPANLASYPDGTVLRSRQVTLVGAIDAASNVDYQLLYRTTNATGQPVATVATVLIPASPAPGSRKLASYQTAYDSLTLNCAPSYTMRGGNDLGSTQNVESGYIEQELQQGWDVVVPDYEGPQSEWAVGPMAGYATLDSIRAAENFAPDGLEGARTPVGMNGYSGGAIASNWAEALAPKYAPDLNIVGVAAGGIFPDLDYTFSTLDNSIWYGVEIGVSVAINRAYPQYDLNSLLNAKGQALAQQDGQDSSGCAGAASNEPGGNAAEYTNYPSSQALAALTQVKDVLNNLNLNNAPVPTAPSYFYNAINDELAHIQPVDQLVAKYCLMGAKIDYYRDPVASEHVAGLAAYFSPALQYLEDRFAGDPVPDTCGAPANASPTSGPGPGPGATLPGCPRATGRLSGVTLGHVRLGMTRARARKAYTHSSNRGKGYEDFFCLTPTGVRVGYASPALLKTLPRTERKRFQGRVIWASTSSVFYAVHGIRPGASLAAARKKLKLEAPFRIGLNTWYLAPNGYSLAVLKARHGIVQEIGIGDRQLTKGRKAQRTFLKSFT
jgi:hypothetical protein